MAADSILERQLAQELGHRLQQMRTSMGLSQEALAQEAGISRNHYQLLEAGLSDRSKLAPANPRLSTLVSLARVLGMPVAELVAVLVGEGPLPNLASHGVDHQHKPEDATIRDTPARGVPADDSPPKGRVSRRRTDR